MSSAVSLPAPSGILFIPRSYDEGRKIVSETQDQQQNVAIIYCIELIFRHENQKWHIRVTLEDLSQSLKVNAKRYQRMKDLEDLCRCISFRDICLLDDTVTEIVLSKDISDSKLPLLPQDEPLDPNIIYASIVLDLRFRTREYAERVRFPLYDNNGAIPAVDWSAVQKEEELGAGVYRVCIKGKPEQYVYKEIDRPLYDPYDTEILQQELRNLMLLRNTKGIVQILAVVISVNPYQTNEGKGLSVLRGIILEYHSRGSLQDLLRSKPTTNCPWLRWAVQLATILDSLHHRQLSHLDIKPANVVIDANGDLVLIDLSGLAVSRNWLSPEMKDILAPSGEDLESRVQNDTWAFGKLLSCMADAATNPQEVRLLKEVATLINVEISMRISLRDAIAKLQQPV
ncbi:kinase-like domain-containing protein [Annulohypoxylon moriforme]|nr:kinase-like domain-containing protein [Annulohypoxylon moriforme]